MHLEFAKQILLSKKRGANDLSKLKSLIFTARCPGKNISRQPANEIHFHILWSIWANALANATCMERWTKLAKKDKNQSFWNFWVCWGLLIFWLYGHHHRKQYLEFRLNNNWYYPQRNEIETTPSHSHGCKHSRRPGREALAIILGKWKRFETGFFSNKITLFSSNGSLDEDF